MWKRRTRRVPTGGFVTRPGAFVTALLLVNAAAYVLCLVQGGKPTIPPRVLYENGALVIGALQPGNWWRLLAAGFLHANPAHLLMNLFSLFMIAPFVERRIGPSTFALVYGLALLGGAIASVALHDRPFIGVGASGAIFGLIGALFALWILGAPGISPQFFLVNFGLNIAFAGRSSRVDWAAHLGGFATGLLAIAVLDALSRTNRFWLACKFPEFVRGNVVLLLALALACAAQAWPQLATTPAAPILLATAGPAALSVIKGLDVLLSLCRGLAAIVLAFAAMNGAFVALLVFLSPFLYTLPCHVALGFETGADILVPFLCSSAFLASIVGGACAAVLTLVAYAGPLRRGLADVGFIGTSLRAERQRERGLVKGSGRSQA